MSNSVPSRRCPIHGGRDLPPDDGSFRVDFGVELTSYDNEQWRRERLLVALGMIHALRPRILCCVKKLHDHKGYLSVHWRVGVVPAVIHDHFYVFGSIWSDLNEDVVEHFIDGDYLRVVEASALGRKQRGRNTREVLNAKD